MPAKCTCPTRFLMGFIYANILALPKQPWQPDTSSLVAAKQLYAQHDGDLFAFLESFCSSPIVFPCVSTTCFPLLLHFCLFFPLPVCFLGSLSSVWGFWHTVEWGQNDSFLIPWCLPSLPLLAQPVLFMLGNSCTALSLAFPTFTPILLPFAFLTHAQASNLSARDTNKRGLLHSVQLTSPYLETTGPTKGKTRMLRKQHIISSGHMV